jgi:AcrR family transcriptional regulator
MRRRRFLEAGLDLVGVDDPRAELTVRAICRRAGLSARYFYESFTDKDELVAAVFDWVLADVAATTQAAVAAAPAAEQTRAGITNLVRTAAEDARIGRLLFDTQLSNPVVARKRGELGGFFALLSGEHLTTAYRLPENAWVKAIAHFVVGGVGQTITGWLSGDVDLEPAQVIDQLVAILEALANPALVSPAISAPAPAVSAVAGAQTASGRRPPAVDGRLPSSAPSPRRSRRIP